MDALKRWVEEVRKQGLSDEEIRQALLQRGYNSEETRRALVQRSYRNVLLSSGLLVGLLILVLAFLMLDIGTRSPVDAADYEQFIELVVFGSQRAAQLNSPRLCLSVASNVHSTLSTDYPWSDLALTQCLGIVGQELGDKTVCDTVLEESHRLYGDCRNNLAVLMQDPELCVAPRARACIADASTV
jgi:hypothetical protein